ncbi:MAG TPA: M48 family metallopeptidase [Leptospiraceae bacterium]|nr:M48 family metallopeptidase [Leptospiraceae bacterium]HMY70089.1 M48 family metallopeptidase [Leptospiraceae bacterium]HMZ58837.1 M48 family metallopeptidase [Leptospiraceae bacterium]HNF12200.1 M48 family metallopeptidase [Leptospiraceae bacterium]HNF24995.1 M48 family metallopeptidase [Leptospiraceae bacterium]
MKNGRLYFVLILCFGIGLIAALSVQEKKTEMDSTLAPFWQLIGKPVQLGSKALTKVIPVSALDEKEYGDAIRSRYESGADKSDPRYIYLNTLIKDLTKTKSKPFDYTVFLMDSGVPNAFAMPGGVLFVTTGLLQILESESELVSILGHEIGHVEKNHCLENVRFQLLTQKIGSETLGKLADLAFGIIVKSSYNKNQEEEADEYAFSLLLSSDYHPAGEGKAFEKLAESHLGKETRSANIITEYFQSHPHTVLRKERYQEKAKAWRASNSGVRKYTGKANLELQKTYSENQIENEWSAE